MDHNFESRNSLHLRPSAPIRLSLSPLLMTSHFPSPDNGFSAPSISLDNNQSISRGVVSETNQGTFFTRSRIFFARPNVTRKSRQMNNKNIEKSDRQLSHRSNWIKTYFKEAILITCKTPKRRRQSVKSTFVVFKTPVSM